MSIPLPTGCTHPATTTSIVPSEAYTSPEDPGHRVSDAIWYTCTNCGASFYLAETLVQKGTPIIAPASEPSIVRS
mgnify:FL=1